MSTVILKWNPKISNYRMCDFERDIKMMKEDVICYDWDFGHSGMVVIHKYCLILLKLLL